LSFSLMRSSLIFSRSGRRASLFRGGGGGESWRPRAKRTLALASVGGARWRDGGGGGPPRASSFCSLSARGGRPMRPTQQMAGRKTAPAPRVGPRRREHGRPPRRAQDEQGRGLRPGRRRRHHRHLAPPDRGQRQGPLREAAKITAATPAEQRSSSSRPGKKSTKTSSTRSQNVPGSYAVDIRVVPPIPSPTRRSPRKSPSPPRPKKYSLGSVRIHRQRPPTHFLNREDQQRPRRRDPGPVRIQWATPAQLAELPRPTARRSPSPAQRPDGTSSPTPPAAWSARRSSPT